MPADFYETLGVEAGASQEEIRKAFQRKSKDHHPDRDGGDDELMAEVNKAYHCLKDPQRRLEYDRTGSVSYVDQEQKIRARVRGVFSTLLQQPIEEDLVGAARAMISKSISEERLQLVHGRRVRLMLEKKAKKVRLKKKGSKEADLFKQVIDDALRGTSQAISTLEDSIALDTAAMQVLDAYESVDEGEHPLLGNYVRGRGMLSSEPWV